MTPDPATICAHCGLGRAVHGSAHCPGVPTCTWWTCACGHTNNGQGNHYGPTLPPRKKP